MADASRPAREHLQPPDLFRSELLGFTQVVTCAAERIVWVAGQTACDVRGRPVGEGDVVEQAQVAVSNLRAGLHAAGASPRDVTMLRVYVVGLTNEIARSIAPAIGSLWTDVPPPASTWVGVQSLFHPAFLVEIEAVAALYASTA